MKGIGFEIVRQEAVERAMARYREQERRKAARERRTTTGGGRQLTREDALNRIAKTHPRSALKILNGYRLGGRKPVPEVR